MLEQVQPGEIVLDIDIQNVPGRLAIVGSEYHSQQTLDDEGVAVGIEVELAPLFAAGQPDLTLATTDDILIGAMLILQRRQLTAEVDDVLVTVFPAVEESEGLENIVAGDVRTELAHAWSLEKHAGFELCFLAHHFPTPGRVEYQLDIYLLYVRHQPYPILDVTDQNRSHAATWRGQRHGDVHPLALLVDIDCVDQPQVDQVHRDLRVEYRLQRGPYLLFMDQVVRRRREAQQLRFKTEPVCVGAIDAHHLTVVGNGVVAAQGLGNGYKGILGNYQRSTIGN